MTTDGYSSFEDTSPPGDQSQEKVRRRISNTNNANRITYSVQDAVEALGFGSFQLRVGYP